MYNLDITNEMGGKVENHIIDMLNSVTIKKRVPNLLTTALRKVVNKKEVDVYYDMILNSYSVKLFKNEEFVEYL